LKLSLKSKILIWFGVIILISFILYGFLIFFVYRFNLRGENYFEALKQHPGIDQSIIDRIRELDKPDHYRLPPPITILPPGLFIRIFFTITGGVLIIIIIAVSSGFLFLRRMLNQINFITKNVKEINDKKLHIRLNLKGKDPISNMAKTFDNMLDQIEKSFKSQKQFIQNASHELNTPLTVIKTKIDVLKQKKAATSNEYKDTMDLIDSEIMRLSKITEQLLVLSDLEENGFKTELGKINFKSVLGKIIKLFDNSINSKNLKLKMNFNGKFEIFWNLMQIEQLLFNLLDNAIKYSVQDNELKINLLNSTDKKYLIFDITNTTVAIKKEDIPNIFERFYKTSNGVNKKGFGLGLSIVKKIAENNNGKIDIDYNENTKEITFKVMLPLYG
jgi:signal transduction histidine kinase